MVRDELCVFMERNHSIGVHGPPPPRSSPPGLCNVNNLAGNVFPERSAHIPPSVSLLPMNEYIFVLRSRQICLRTNSYTDPNQHFNTNLRTLPFNHSRNRNLDLLKSSFGIPASI